MANALHARKQNTLNVIHSASVETADGSTAVLSAAENGPIGGKIYTAAFSIVSTNGTATVTPSLYGSLDGTGFFKLSDLEGSDLSTNRTLNGATASTVIGVFDLRNFHAIPFFKLAAVADAACTATWTGSMVM